ncbi:MAG: hypothetical protein KGR22_06305 [Planctomycetes bacterium]|nr:hypothetical protein [Planctomycetota bacterium]
MAPVFDLVIVTASNELQAQGYRLELAWRTERGLLPGIAAAHVLPDPLGRRAGSGSSTLIAIEWAARHFGAKGTAGVGRALSGRRIAIVHCGGDSRRLPAFSAHGKVFAPMPGAPGSDDSVFAQLMRDLVSIVPRPGQVIVAAGDMMLHLEGRAIDLSGPDISVLASPQPYARAKRHGVFVAKGERVHSALQKPSLAAARAAGAIDRHGMLLVDTGVIAFSPATCQSMLRAAGPGLMRSIARGDGPVIDLYDHLMRAAMPGLSRRDFAAPYRASGQWSDALARLHEGLRARHIHATLLSPCSFDHAGSSREYLELLTRFAKSDHVRLHARARRVHHAAHGQPLAPGRPQLADGRTALVDCLLDRARLGGSNLLVGLGLLGPSIALPKGWCAFDVPLLGRRAVRVLHGIDDDFKTTLDDGATLGGHSLATLLQDRSIAQADVFDPSTTSQSLWTARLWPVVAITSAARDPRLMDRLLGWMLRPGARPSAAWRASERLSVAELASKADAQAMVKHHHACVSAALVHDVPEWIVRDRAASPLLAHDALAGAAPALELATGYIKAARRARDPLDRARVQMALSNLTARHLPGTVPANELRAAAMRSVGEAVAQSIALPDRPARTAIRPGQTVHAHAPVRLDLAGGWSDTPPICNEVGGTVLNTALLLHGTHPIKVVARLTHEPVITIHSVDQGHAVTIRDSATALDFADPREWDALPKAALVLSGIVPSDSSLVLRRTLQRFGGGVSLTIFSGVPKGSGLGTSSIFGATMLAALAAMVGEDFSAQRAEADLRQRRRSAIERLVVRTSLLEQMIGTRGGWQDQVGGLVGGFKITRTDPGRGQWPAVERLALDQTTIDAFHARSVLVYTGLQRMAKDILETVVGGWLVRDPRRVAAVNELKLGAESMRAHLLAGDLDGFAGCLADYWRLKRVMDPASTNEAIEAMVEPVERELAAWTLAGAGGGGFMLLVAKDPRAAARIRDRWRRRPPAPGAREVALQVAPSGLDVTVL